MARENKSFGSGDDSFLDDPEAEFDDTEVVGDTEIDIDEADALRLEVAELKDRLLRALADTENLRKRSDRDRRDAELYASTRFARDLLSVYDNFDRAMGNVTDAVREAAPGLIEGIELTQRDLLAAFEKHKIHKIVPEVGEHFDPKQHQAMFEAPIPGTKAGDIVQIMGVGFNIGDRLLRPAQVGVSSGAPAMPRPPESGAESASE